MTVGLQQTAYTVTEVDDYQLVCFEVLSGDVDGRELVFSYSTVSGTASKLVAIEVPSMLNHISYTATSDYTATSGTATITEDTPFQCVSIRIRYDSITETTNECFKFRITSSNTVSGLTVDPNEANICIVDLNCEFEILI